VLAVSDVRVEGERLEGRGVVPDVEVPFRLPYAAGRDPQLDAALGKLAHGRSQAPPCRATGTHQSVAVRLSWTAPVRPGSRSPAPLSLP
jgi:C-terminal processing protease CtpA/Prc